MCQVFKEDKIDWVQFSKVLQVLLELIPKDPAQMNEELDTPASEPI